MNKGQTKQHLEIIKGMGIEHVIIGVNKMDVCDWSEKSFTYIKCHMENYFSQDPFFKEKEFKYIPLSAYHGDNLTFNMDLPFYKGNCLLKEIQAYEIPQSIQEEGAEKPIRLTIKNVYRNNKGVLKGRLIEVKVEGGTVQPGNKLKAIPGSVLFSVKNIYLNHKAVKTAQFGDVIDMSLNMDKDTDFEFLSEGSIGKRILYTFLIIRNLIYSL